jgi:hypothetical protein
MEWDVFLSTKALKQKNKLSDDLQFALFLLTEDLKNKGGILGKTGLIIRSLKG